MLDREVVLFQKKAGCVLDAIDEELRRHDLGEGSISTPEQLRKIRQSIVAMKSSLEQGSADSAHIGFGRVIADSWPIDSSLGAALLDVEQSYKKMIRK